MVALFVLFLFLFFVILDLVVLKFQKRIHPAFEIKSPKYLQFSTQKEIYNTDEIFFSPGHTWLKYDSDLAVNLGLDEFAVKALGNAPVNNYPAINKKIKKGDILFQSESDDKKIKFFSPIDGVVKSVKSNSTKRKNIYDQWMIQMIPMNINPKRNSFLTGKEASQWMKKEFARLEDFINQHAQKKELAGVTMFDGGSIVEGAIFNLPENKIELFEKEFLSLQSGVKNA